MCRARHTGFGAFSYVENSIVESTPRAEFWQLQAYACRAVWQWRRDGCALPFDTWLAAWRSLRRSFTFEALGVSPQRFLHKDWVDAEVGPFEPFKHFRKFEKVSIGSRFQNPKRPRNCQPTFQGSRASTPIIQQNLIGVNFLSQTDGFHFASAQRQLLINPLRRPDRNPRLFPTA